MNNQLTEQEKRLQQLRKDFYKTQPINCPKCACEFNCPNCEVRNETQAKNQLHYERSQREWDEYVKANDGMCQEFR